MERICVDLKVTSENPMTGLRRIRVPKQHVENLREIIKFEFNQDLPEVVRNYRESKNGWISFNCGVGYAVIDADLLGGNADGEREQILNYDYNMYFRIK